MRIFNHASITYSIPKESSNILFLYFKKIVLSKILNFNKFISSLDLDPFFRDNYNLTCDYADSCFKDKDHGLI